MCIRDSKDTDFGTNGKPMWDLVPNLQGEVTNISLTGHIRDKITTKLRTCKLAVDSYNSDEKSKQENMKIRHRLPLQH